MTNNVHARFAFNNFIESGSYTTSSALSSYPASNLTSGVRSSYWQAEGVFAISSSTNKIYINGTTYSIGAGNYTAATLISALNSATGQTFTRNSAGRFVCTLGSSGTLNLATTTDAIWSTLGFLGTSNLSGTVFTADERRHNNGEWIKVDVGHPQLINFAALLPPNEEIFSCANAVIKLQGNNVDVWTSPPVDLPMQVSSVGAFLASSTETQPCRYWRIYIDDVKNPSIKVSVASMATSVISTNTNIAVGFSRTRVDPSIRLYSEGGQLYVDRRPRLLTLSNVGVLFLNDTDLVELEQLMYDLGVGRPFFICIDPQNQVSSELSQMTHYVQLDSDATLTHVLRGYYNLAINMREVV